MPGSDAVRARSAPLFFAAVEAERVVPGSSASQDGWMGGCYIGAVAVDIPGVKLRHGE